MKVTPQAARTIANRYAWVKHSRASTKRVLTRIQKANADLVPRLVGLEFIRFVRDPSGPDMRWDADYAWSVYISHDPCHDDGKGRVDDRNTVIAVHKHGWLRIIGRELPWTRAVDLALGRV
jgi:hypothetical protein